MKTPTDLMLTIKYSPCGSVWKYPLVGVYAPDKASADSVAAETGDPYDQRAWLELAIDSAAAQVRLGIFGNAELADRVARGD